MEIKEAVNVMKKYTNKPISKTVIEAHNMAIAALEKQIPKKVDEDDCCPLCHTYGKDDNGVAGDYCPNCGQKLLWENEDAE